MNIPEGGVVVGEDGTSRCWWCAGDPLYRSYHDDEWGRPVSDDRTIFEKIVLEGFQSGLSWLIILRKRENFRRAFRNFEIPTVARFDARAVETLMGDAGIVRNRAKIESTINNARRCLELVDEFGSLAAYVWSFEPVRRPLSSPLEWETLGAMGGAPEARAMSKDLKRRGWSFVGPTTIYSAMESIGLVNDHVTRCEMREAAERARLGFRPPRKPEARREH